LDMLRHNPRPGESPLPSSGRSVPAAWKTGTSYAYRDAWSVGVIGPYVLAVWVGNFDGSSNPAFVGREAAAPLFFAIADSLSEGLPTTSPAAPSSLNLRAVDVCAATGDLPGRHCPATTRAWFIPGVSPIRVSDVHRAIRIDNATGLRACEFDPATTHEAVFEFWSSDLAKVFRQAGIALRTPPPWHPNCSPDLTAASGNAPRIVSPLAGVTYHVRHREGAASDHNQIAFQAVTDANVRSLYWFINDRFVERVARDKPLLWPAKAGTYTVVAVDDAGRSHSRPLSVKLAP
ncbi:MAG: penicillin-binding protein 1C, partial [Pseudomonadota bacterium]